MKITVIGGGAMGSIYAGHLSESNEVCLVDTNPEIVEQVQRKGITLLKDGKETIYHPCAVTSTKGWMPSELIILFVKSAFTRSALNDNRRIIGTDTYLMTLQNGSGHEEILGQFVPKERIIIGTTEDNGTVLAPAYVRHAGTGKTNFGMLTEDTNGILLRIQEIFNACGFQSCIYENIQQLVWDKLFTNASLSALTGVLQVPMGFIANNQYAWQIAEKLIHEAVEVAHAIGVCADEKEIKEMIRQNSLNSPEGITSICADIQAGRRTEVDAISGSIVRASKMCNILAPTHELIVELIHSLEDRMCWEK